MRRRQKMKVCKTWGRVLYRVSTLSGCLSPDAVLDIVEARRQERRGDGFFPIYAKCCAVGRYRILKSRGRILE